MEESDFLACCGSTRFAKEMAAAAPFGNCGQAVQAARDIWMNKVDVNGLLEAFGAHPQIGDPPSAAKESKTSAQWSQGEQSVALATATSSSLQELFEWNILYRQKFGFVFLICASGRSTSEILAELKRRYHNRPLVELEVAAGEQMKITELRLAKLFASKTGIMSSSAPAQYPPSLAEKAAEDRLSMLGAHLTGGAGSSTLVQPTGLAVSQASSTRTRPPITTHVLDVARGHPASGIEVYLEKWRGALDQLPSVGKTDSGEWVLQGSSVTNADGRSGAVTGMVDNIPPGFYRLTFNTRKYNPSGFFPYVSITFEIKESQGSEQFHVPLLLSPFSFSTYRGS